MGLGKVSILCYFSSEQDVLLAGAGRALLLLIRCKGEILSGMKITAIQALGDNLFSGSHLEPCIHSFSFHLHLTDHCVLSSVVAFPHGLKQS